MEYGSLEAAKLCTSVSNLNPAKYKRKTNRTSVKNGKNKQTGKTHYGQEQKKREELVLV